MNNCFLSCITTKSAHKTYIKCLIQLTNKNLVTSAHSNIIKFWDIHSFKCIGFTEKHQGKVSCIIQLYNGYLASASDDKTIMLWDTLAFNHITTIRVNQQIHTIIQLSTGGIASCLNNSSIKIWSTQTFQCSTSIDNEIAYETAITELSNGSLMFNVNNSKLQVIDMRTRKFSTMTHHHILCINTIKQLNNGDIVTLSHYTLCLWNVLTLTIKQTISNCSFCTCITELLDGTLIIGDSQGSIQIWRRRNEEKLDMKDLLTYKCQHLGKITGVIELIDGNIASCSYDQTVKIWEINQL